MTANELFEAGRLREAIDAQAAAVRNRPTDDPARFFLFELLLFTGDLDRARKQLDVFRPDDAARTVAVLQYRNALAAEAQRRDVLAGTARPKILGAVADHIHARLDALACLARGDHAAARQLLDEANAAPQPVCTLDDRPGGILADADERFGPVLEVYGTGGVYTWLPLDEVASVVMSPPRAPRDVLMRPAHVALHNGVSGDVLLPGLYPDTHTHPDDAIRLGRVADWIGTDDEVVRGVGGKVFRVGDEFVPLAAIGRLGFDKPGG
jgi:type VI secretion system protein ImpE